MSDSQPGAGPGRPDVPSDPFDTPLPRLLYDARTGPGDFRPPGVPGGVSRERSGWAVVGWVVAIVAGLLVVGSVAVVALLGFLFHSLTHPSGPVPAPSGYHRVADKDLRAAIEHLPRAYSVKFSFTEGNMNFGQAYHVEMKVSPSSTRAQSLATVAYVERILRHGRYGTAAYVSVDGGSQQNFASDDDLDPYAEGRRRFGRFGRFAGTLGWPEPDLPQTEHRLAGTRPPTVK